jgi:hypothetical protein
MHVSATAELTVYTTCLAGHRRARFPRIDRSYPTRETILGACMPEDIRPWHPMRGASSSIRSGTVVLA